jgi:DNA replication protein DnaC
MPQSSSEREAAHSAFREAARSLFISCDTIDSFLATATPGQLSACTSMLEGELAHREHAKRERLLRQARFPVPKSAEGFDWTNVSFPDGWGREDMLSLGFVGAAQDLVFYGQTGRGKTHMATAVGMMAVAQGIPVRFCQTAQLVLELGRAKREGTLDRVFADILKARLLILDEFGYVPFDVDGARLLFQVISESYERRSIIFTTNIEFSRWGTVFADDKLAAAIVDRVVHHGRLVEFGGPSHRLEESLMLGKSGR